MEAFEYYWIFFKDQIVPILTALSTAVLPIIYTLLQVRLKRINLENKSMSEVIGENSKTLKENSKVAQEMEALNEKNKQLQTEIKTIAEMIYTIFMNSNLSAEKKSKLSGLYSLIINEDSQKTIDELREEVLKWQDMYRQADENLKEKETEQEEAILSKSTMVRS